MEVSIRQSAWGWMGVGSEGIGELVQGGWDRVVWVVGLELGLGSCPIIKEPFELGQAFSSCPFSVLFRTLPAATQGALWAGRDG